MSEITGKLSISVTHNRMDEETASIKKLVMIWTEQYAVLELVLRTTCVALVDPILASRVAVELESPIEAEVSPFTSKA